MNESPDKKPPQDLLDWLGISNAPNWAAAPMLGRMSGAILTIAVPLLFLLALVAAFAVAGHTIVQVIHGGSEASPNLGAGALIGALLGGPFLIWGTVLKHQTVRYQKEGHMTDRIAKAVEQLGAEKTVERIGRSIILQSGHEEAVDDPNDISFRTDIEWKGETVGKRETEFVQDRSEGSWQVFKQTLPNLEVRMGAILSLERIAQDSTTHDNGRDHVRAMEILCAYIRHNAPVAHRNPSPTPFETKRPRLDVQTAINVIKRRTAEQKALEAAVKYRLDLREVDFDGVDLSNGDFAGAILYRGRFEATNFYSANFKGARLNGSLVNFPDFRRANLKGANFRGASIHNLQFGGFGLASECNIFVEEATLSGVHFTTRNHLNFFGSQDTVVDWSYRDAKAAAAERATDSVLESLPDDEAERADDGLSSRYSAIDIEKSKLFLHWNPFTADDFASGEFRRPYCEKHGLIGWPYED